MRLNASFVVGFLLTVLCPCRRRYQAKTLRLYYLAKETSKAGKSKGKGKSKPAAAAGAGAGAAASESKQQGSAAAAATVTSGIAPGYEKVYVNVNSTLGSVLSRKDYVVPELPVFYVEPIK